MKRLGIECELPGQVSESWTKLHSRCADVRLDGAPSATRITTWHHIGNDQFPDNCSDKFWQCVCRAKRQRLLIKGVQRIGQMLPRALACAIFEAHQATFV